MKFSRKKDKKDVAKDAPIEGDNESNVTELKVTKIDKDKVTVEQVPVEPVAETTADAEVVEIKVKKPNWIKRFWRWNLDVAKSVRSNTARALRAMGRGLKRATKATGRGIKVAAPVVGKSLTTVGMTVLKVARFALNIVMSVLMGIAMLLVVLVAVVFSAAIGLLALINWGFTALMRKISPASYWTEEPSGFSFTDIADLWSTSSSVLSDIKDTFTTDEDLIGELVTDDLDTTEIKPEHVPAPESTDLEDAMAETSVMAEVPTVDSKNRPATPEETADLAALREQMAATRPVSKDEAKPLLSKVEDIDPNKPLMTQLMEIEMPSIEITDRLNNKQFQVMGRYFRANPFTLAELKAMSDEVEVMDEPVLDLASYEMLLDHMLGLGRMDMRALTQALRNFDAKKKSGRTKRPSDKPGFVHPKLVTP